MVLGEGGGRRGAFWGGWFCGGVVLGSGGFGKWVFFGVMFF